MNEAAPEVAKPKLKLPKMFTVAVKNDDYTTTDFVVDLLMKVFAMPKDQANASMHHIHTKGKVRIGKYTKDVADTKAGQAKDLALEKQHPLHVHVEEV